MTVVEQACRRLECSTTVITGLLAPALVEVGRQWAAGEAGAAEAMAASAIVRSCIPRSAVPTSQSPANGRLVAVCCPPGEDHEIPGEMVAELLRQQGWSALNMGSGLTPQQLPRFLADQRPAAVLVSATTAAALAGTAQIIAEAHGHGVPVLVGGAAFGRDDLLALRLGAAGWASTVSQAVVLLETWRCAPPVLPTRPSLPDGYLQLTAALPAITAAATAAVHSGDAEPWSRDETDECLDQLLRHLEATLLVDDGRILHDFVSRRSEYYRTRGLSATRLDNAMHAIAQALPAACDRSRRFIIEGRQHLAWGNSTPNEIGCEPTTVNEAIVASPRNVASPAEAGQVFADLLYVAASSCRAPMAWLSVAQPNGAWNTLRHNTDPVTDRRARAGENQLITLIASRDDHLEIGDLAAHPELDVAALAREAGAIQFVYGIALRNSQHHVLGVLCILDRRPRQLTGRERQVADAIARQLTGQLERHNKSDPSTARNHQPTDGTTCADSYGDRATLPLASGETFLRTRDVAALFDVTPRTVANWATDNKLPSVRTAGKQLRFRRHDVLALLARQQRPLLPKSA
ncbi:MAG: hypothetical protein QOK39_249 [Acidimicrobiaceae bacterium]|nr:hypothetical protein [Acidimicrobiaceae bacterium]